MRYTCLLIAMLISPPVVMSQTSDPVTRAGLVKDAVGTIAATDKKYAEVVLKDLREFRGKIVAVYEDFFIIEPKKKKGLKIVVISIGNTHPRIPGKLVRYRDVLQIGGKHGVVSFVPDPRANPYSTWDDVRSIGRGEFVQVHRSTGSILHGVCYRTTPDTLTLMKGNKEVVIFRTDVTKVYRVKGDTRSLATRIVEGATKGATISEDCLPISDPRANGHPVSVAIGAAVGATFYVLSIGRTERVLVYSR